MYVVTLAYSDDPARLELRPEHRERTAALAAEGKLLVGGPWGDESGALLVFLVDGRAELEQILADDPYYTAPGVTTEVRELQPVTRHACLADL